VEKKATGQPQSDFPDNPPPEVEARLEQMMRDGVLPTEEQLRAIFQQVAQDRGLLPPTPAEQLERQAQQLAQTLPPLRLVDDGEQSAPESSETSPPGVPAP